MSKDELKNINNTNSSKKGNYFFLIQNAYENDNENGDGNGNGNENNNNKCNNENNINDDENINSTELQSIENLLNKKNMNRSKSNHVINNCNPINNININANNTDFNTDNMNGCKNLNKNSNSTHSSNNKLSKSLTVSTFSLFTDDKKLNSMNTKIEYIHLVHIESVLIYILTYIIMIIVVLLYIPKSNSIENNYIQEFDGKWRYKCSLEYINSIMNAVELTLIIYLLLKVFKTWNYICVFKCLKYIGLSSLIWVTLGPLLISKISIYNNSNVYNWFNILLNGLCYILMLLLYIWDKIYYVLKKKGNDPYNYFYVEKHEECSLHKTHHCDCIKTKISENVVIRYINFYKQCSQFLILSNGNIKYVKKESKNPLRFVI
eukprot:jgi/Orpsp1_1/1174494/evm.model.c7180000050324.1